jgi:hypothetical protein
MPNYDETTGIYYGVINPHSITPEVLNDLYDRGTDPIYKESKKQLTDKINELFELIGFIGDDKESDLRDEIEQIFNDNYQSDGSGIYDYEDQEYTLHVSGDNFGIFVIKSPYYTFCRKCSPCAPNAGDLDSPINPDDYEVLNLWDKAYCLDKSYFEGEKVPYRVYRVDNDQEVV